MCLCLGLRTPYPRGGGLVGVAHLDGTKPKVRSTGGPDRQPHSTPPSTARPAHPLNPPHTHPPAQVRRISVRPTGSTNSLTPHTPATPKLTLVPSPRADAHPTGTPAGGAIAGWHSPS